MPVKNIDAPLALFTDIVRPEWLDYNQHMTEGYYGVVFGNATDAFMDFIGLDAEYREKTKCTIYTVETHTYFLQELKANNPLHLTTQLLGFDAKRLHIFHQMYHATEDYLAATMEAMLLHVNNEPRVVAMPPKVLAKAQATLEAHSILPRPSQAGRSINMPAKNN